ncbi:hypothetical protein Acr_00g0016270 [Actinidia rufa]|uniref:Uncharacterized protein n=1 Tax=Actinidia rufa TaxID=165716 RepID=A0A7J0DBE8_9ERIC|nr:hypothetical protein Acr_00g0016270 [Actinidia rufa]
MTCISMILFGSLDPWEFRVGDDGLYSFPRCNGSLLDKTQQLILEEGCVQCTKAIQKINNCGRARDVKTLLRSSASGLSSLFGLSRSKAEVEEGGEKLQMTSVSPVLPTIRKEVDHSFIEGGGPYSSSEENKACHSSQDPDLVVKGSVEFVDLMVMQHIQSLQRAMANSEKMKKYFFEAKKALNKAITLESELKKSKEKLVKLGTPAEPLTWAAAASEVELPDLPKAYSPLILSGFNEEKYMNHPVEGGNEGAPRWAQMQPTSSRLEEVEKELEENIRLSSGRSQAYALSSSGDNLSRTVLRQLKLMLEKFVELSLHFLNDPSPRDENPVARSACRMSSSNRASEHFDPAHEIPKVGWRVKR